MQELDHVGELFDRFRRPLTAEDIDRIEEGVNFLVSTIYAGDEEALEEELQMDLSHKMGEYIDTADAYKSDPKLGEIATILGDEMRALLYRVNAYYHQLN